MSLILDKVREQYPDAYKDVSDDDLTLKLGQKYPQYLNQDKDFNADFQRVSQVNTQRQATLTGQPAAPIQPRRNVFGESKQDLASKMIDARAEGSGGEILDKLINAGMWAAYLAPARGTASRLLLNQSPEDQYQLPSLITPEQGTQPFTDVLHGENPLNAIADIGGAQKVYPPAKTAIEKVLTGGSRSAGELLSAASHPDSLELMMFGGPGARVFQAEMIKSAPDVLQRLSEASSTGDLEETTKAAADALLTIGAPLAIEKGIQRHAVQERKPTPVPLGETSGNRAEVGARIPEQPAQSTEALGEWEAKANVTPQVLTDADYSAAERQAIDEAAQQGSPLKIVDKFTGEDENNPFSRYIAQATEGGIEIKRSEFRKNLERVPPERRAGYIKSLIGEEHIHRHVADSEALNYWNTLTAPEQSIEIRQYAGKGLWTKGQLNRFLQDQGGQGLSETQLGHEAVRRRIQQLSGQTPTEVAESALRERWTLKTIDGLSRVIRSTRETLGTAASKEALGILDDVQSKLDVARGIVSPSAEMLIGMTPQQVVDWKKSAKYGPETSKAIAEKLTPEQSEQVKAQSAKLRQDSKDLINTGDMANMQEAQNVSLKSAILREIGEDYDARKNPASFRRVNDDELRARAKDELPDLEDEFKRVWNDFEINETRDAFNDAVDDEKLISLYERAFGQNVTPELLRNETNVRNNFINRLVRWGFKERVDPTQDQSRKQLVDYVKRSHPDLWHEAFLESINDSPDNKYKAFALEKLKSLGMTDFGDLALRDWQNHREDVWTQNPGLAAFIEKHVFQKDFGSIAEEPAAAIRRRGKEDERTPQLGLTAGGTPEGRPSATEVGAGTKVTASAIEKAGAEHLQAETDRVLNEYSSNPDKRIKPPSFEQYADAMQKKFEGVKRGQLSEAYSNNLWTRLFNASGKTLEALQRSVGINIKGRIPDPPERAKFTIEQEVKGAAKAQLKAEQIGSASRQRYRIGAIRMIADKLLADAQPEKETRTSISPEDIRHSGESTQPPYFDVSKDDLAHPELLGPRLAADSRRSNRDPVSLTKRVTALLDKQSGKVYLVSTYPHGRSGAMLLDPSVSQIKAHRPLSQLLTRYRPVASMLLDEPVRGFKQSFDSLGDFESKLGTDARRASQSFTEAPLREGETDSSGSWENGGPITDAEAASILDHISAEVGNFDSPDDVKASLAALKEDTNYQVLSGYRKLAAEILAKNPDLTDVGLINQLAQNIYENHIAAGKSETPFETFVGRTMAQGNAPDREGLAVPANKGTIESGKAKPASIRRQLADDIEATKQLIKDSVSAKYTRDIIARRFDDAQNLPNNRAREIENGIRLASTNTRGVKGDKQVLAAANPLVYSGAIRTNGTLDVPLLRARLLVFKDLVNTGLADARRMLASGSWMQRRRGRIKERGALQLKEELDYAEAHINDPQLLATAIRMKGDLDNIYNEQRANGVEVNRKDNYIPGRYDISGTDGKSVFMQEPRIIGTKFREPSVFANYYEAIAKPDRVYVAATRDGATLVSHATRRGLELIQRNQTLDFIKNLQAPDGQPAAVDSMISPGGAHVAPSGFANYESVKVGGKIIFAHPIFKTVLRRLFSGNVIEDTPVLRQILHFEQGLKHRLLMGDTFHLGKMSAFGASLMREKMGFKAGWSVLDIADRDLAEAVRQGVISPKEAAWGNERINFGGQQITRRQLVRRAQQGGVGFNVGKIGDALYKDVMSELTPVSGPLRRAFTKITDPTSGRYNRFLFDTYTRGLMAESLVSEFERQSKALPNANPVTLLRDISRDLNNYYGNIGRQGWLKAKWEQDAARMLLLAPQWVEGLIKKEVVGASRLTGLSTVLGKRKGKAVLGATGTGMGTGILTMIALTQALNFISRGKPTWQNEEPEHKFDAYIPAGGGRGEGMWLNPLSLFAELSHDLWRLSVSKPKFIDAVDQIAGNKESPVLRAAMIAATGVGPNKQQYTTTAGQLKAAGVALVPVPISFGKLGRAAGHAVAPNLIAPNRPGDVQRQLLASVGVKTEAAATAYQKLRTLAGQFMEENGYAKDTGWTQVMTDEDSYTKLRSQLRNGDSKGAADTFQSLLKGRTESDITKAMQHWSKQPFTGSKEHETAFIGHLSPEELKLYDKAEEDRFSLLDAYYSFLLKQP